MELNRRSFLKGAGAAAAAAAVASTASVAAADEAPEVLTYETLESKNWSWMIPPEPIADEDIAEVKTHEIVVIGSGMSGLCCGASAAQMGADVIVFSAGTKPISRGGSVQAIGSKYEAEQGVEDNPDLRREQIMMDQVAANHMINSRLWERWMNKSAESMDWAIDMLGEKGLYPSLAPQYDDVDVLNGIPGEHNFWNENAVLGVFQGAPLMAAAWASYLTDDYGCEIDYETVAQYLIRDDNNTGRVSAVIAKDKDGRYIKYEATKAIVLATGDFSKDPDMMAYYCPYAWKQFKDMFLASTEVDYDVAMGYNGLMPGTGQKMGLWIGAAWQKAIPNAPMMNGAVSGPGWRVIDSFCGINLASDGKRFHNENTNFAFGAYDKLYLPDQTAYGIWDINYAYTRDEWPGLGCTINNVTSYKPKTAEETAEGWKAGRYITADTLEDLVAQLDIDQEEALASIARYNEYAKNGCDEEYHVNPALLHPIDTPPFFATKSTGGTFLTVMGGLRCDENLQILDENDQPIEGLYEVGTMIGDFFAGTYNFAISGLNLGACCTTFPYLLGRDLAAL
ncbi:MAG: FAD-binding protein [Coriobacteriales bacterium]|nr:FAD-binding protein [Coriobacteriales bacterium]